MFQGYGRWITLAAVCVGCGLFLDPSRGSASEPVTLWRFLGIPQAVKHIHLQTFNRFGKHPGLEPKPPLKAISDPANLTAGVPASPAAGATARPGVAMASLRNAEQPEPDPALEAVRKAAEIKQAEELAPQKIKALRYLATIGCADPEVAGALSKSMDIQNERVERVRYAAVQAVIDSAGDQCAHCNTDTCCTPDLLEKMALLAFGRDSQGCWLEPSERVREAMQEALQKCCPASFPVIEVPHPTPLPPENGIRPPEEEGILDLEGAPVTVLQRGVLLSDMDTAPIWPTAFLRNGEERRDPRDTLTTAHGVVLRVEPSDNTVLIACPEEGRAIEGTFITVRRSFLTGSASIGTLKVVRADAGYVVAVPHRLIRSVKNGDDVVLFMQVP